MCNKLSGCTINRTDNKLWSLEPNINQYSDIQYNNYTYRIYGVQYGKYALSLVPDKNTMYSEENSAGQLNKDLKIY